MEHAAYASPRERWVLALVLVLAALARGLFVAERTKAPDFEHPIVDAGFHDDWARSLADPNWKPLPGIEDPGLRTRAYLRPPGYPYFLALVYALSGGSALAPLVVQALLGLSSALLAFAIGRRYFGPWAGPGVAAALGFYWVLVYFEGELHDPALLVFLCLALYAQLGRWAERPRAGVALAAGVLLGMAALVRPNVLLFAPVVLVWGFWVAGGRRAGAQILRSAAAGVLGCALAVAPVTLRNWIVAHDFVLISTNAGINLWIGNYEGATGFVAEEIAGLGRFETCYDYPRIVARLEERLGRPLADSEVSAWFSDEARAWIAANPGDALALTAKKAGYFWGPIEIPHNKELRAERAHSRVLRLLPGNFGALLALAAIGFALLFRDRRRGADADRARWRMAVLALAFVLAYFFSVLPFFQAARYRVPVLPFLMLFAAYAFARLVALLEVRAWSRAAVGVAAWTGIALLLMWPARGEQPLMDKWHRDRGLAYMNAGDAERALPEYRAAIEASPGDAVLHYDLGLALEKLGDPGAALDAYAAAVRLGPGDARARNNLGNLLGRAGRVAEALPHFEAAVLHDPGYALAFQNLGRACALLQRLPEAIEAYRRWVALEPENAAAHATLAETQAAAGEIEQALETVERGLRQVPANDSAGRQRLEAARATLRAARARSG